MKVIIDPKEARQFAKLLDERAADLKQLDSTLSRTFLDLKLNYWKDSRYQQFEKRYEEASVLLNRFLEHAAKYATYLRRKAVPIERYLDRRYR
jgi:hypothetical protein